MHGRISSAWNVNNALLTCKTNVPANTTATLYLPAASADAVKEAGRIIVKTKGVTLARHEAVKAVYELKAGSYLFTVPTLIQPF